MDDKGLVFGKKVGRWPKYFILKECKSFDFTQVWHVVVASENTNETLLDIQ